MFKQSPSALWRRYGDRYNCTAEDLLLVTWSQIYASPTGFSAPYIVAIAEDNTGKRSCVQLTDVDEADLSYGLKLKPVFRKAYDTKDDGIIPYGTKYTI